MRVCVFVVSLAWSVWPAGEGGAGGGCKGVGLSFFRFHLYANIFIKKGEGGQVSGRGGGGVVSLFKRVGGECPTTTLDAVVPPVGGRAKVSCQTRQVNGVSYLKSEAEPILETLLKPFFLIAQPFFFF